jgi:hypothetical protein
VKFNELAKMLNIRTFSLLNQMMSVYLYYVFLPVFCLLNFVVGVCLPVEYLPTCVISAQFYCIRSPQLYVVYLPVSATCTMSAELYDDCSTV